MAGPTSGIDDAPADDLLRRRAERLARPLAADTGPQESQLVVAELALGDARYALPFADLQAALPLKDVTPVPLAPAHVIGVLRFRGQPVTALSLASLLGIRGWRRDPAVLLVVATAHRPIAIDSEAIPRQTTLARAAVDGARLRGGSGILEVATARGEIVNLLELGRLLAARGLS
jgi:purine-binding chemotaxis protein CheW